MTDRELAKDEKLMVKNIKELNKLIAHDEEHLDMVDKFFDEYEQVVPEIVFNDTETTTADMANKTVATDDTTTRSKKHSVVTETTESIETTKNSTSISTGNATTVNAANATTIDAFSATTKLAVNATTKESTMNTTADFNSIDVNATTQFVDVDSKTFDAEHHALTGSKSRVCQSYALFIANLTFLLIKILTN